MGSRAEPDDSLDYFATPPFATRALVEHVLPHLGVRDLGSVWEPACGEGHMAEVLREYCDDVRASDVFEYGYGEILDFLESGRVLWPTAEWIITNPPFNEKAIQFVIRARELAPNVAMFFRSQWAVEGIGRYQSVFRDHPPTLCAFFVERVPLCKGRWDPDGTTATAYCWLVWMQARQPQPPLWIPPGCRKRLTLPYDRERFTAKPVIKRIYGSEVPRRTLPTARESMAQGWRPTGPRQLGADCQPSIGEPVGATASHFHGGRDPVSDPGLSAGSPMVDAEPLRAE